MEDRDDGSVNRFGPGIRLDQLKVNLTDPIKGAGLLPHRHRLEQQFWFSMAFRSRIVYKLNYNV